MIKYFYILTPTLTFLGSPMLMDPPSINRKATSYSKFGQVLPWENIDHGISSLLRVCLAPLQHFRSVVQENAAKEPEQGLEIDNYFYTSLPSFPFIFLVSSMKQRHLFRLYFWFFEKTKQFLHQNNVNNIHLLSRGIETK